MSEILHYAFILDDYSDSVLDRRGRFNPRTEAPSTPSGISSTPRHLTPPTTQPIVEEAEKVKPAMGKG